MSDGKPNGITDEQIAAWKREHGDDLRSVTTSVGTLVFRPPSRVAWDRCVDRISADPKERSQHVRELGQACLVHPDPAGYRAILDGKPAALLNSIFDAIGEMAGLGDGQVAKL